MELCVQATQLLHISGSNLMENPSLKINKITPEAVPEATSWSAILDGLGATGVSHIDNIIDMIAQRNKQVKEKFSPTLHL